MARFNKPANFTDKTTNECGMPAFKMDAKTKLVTMVLTTFFGEPKFYGKNEPALYAIVHNLIDSGDAEFVAKLAVYARREFNMRSVAHALTVLLANTEKGKPFVQRVCNGVILRADDVTEIMSAQLEKYGKPIPNCLKKGLAAAMNKFDGYQFAKYERRSNAISFKDVLRLTHTKAVSDAQNDVFKSIIGETLEIPYTWETELSTKGNTKEVWEALIESGRVGYMATLRNLANILRAAPDNLDKVIALIADPNEVRKSRQLPFRFVSAFVTLKACGLLTSKVADALETAAEISIENLSRLPGKTLIAIDVSGSMMQSISQQSIISSAVVACTIGALAGKICDESIVVSFDSKLYFNVFPAKNGVISNALSVDAHGGCTDIRLPISYLIDNKIKVDRIILLSDNEINVSYAVIPSSFFYFEFKKEVSCQQLLTQYREEVNPDVWMHAIDLQGYGTQQFKDGRTNIIGGWGERVLEFIDQTERGMDNITAAISAYEI